MVDDPREPLVVFAPTDSQGALSSRGLGRVVLSHQTRVRIPVALPALTGFAESTVVKIVGELQSAYFHGIQDWWMGRMPDKFHERFDIDVPIDEARRRFVNRVHNELLSQDSDLGDLTFWADLGKAIVDELGEPYKRGDVLHAGTMEIYTKLDFYRTLQAIEAFSAFVGPWKGQSKVTQRVNARPLDSFIRLILRQGLLPSYLSLSMLIHHDSVNLASRAKLYQFVNFVRTKWA